MDYNNMVVPNVPTETEYIKTPSDLYAQDLQTDKVKNILAQIDPANQLENIEMRLRGYKLDPYSKQWIKAFDGITDEDLIDRYINWLSSKMSLNVTMGNLSTQQINKIMKQAVEWVTDDLDAHAERYGFGDDYTERSRVGDILLESAFFVLKRCENGAEARRFWSSFNLSETAGTSNFNQNKGDWWKFWKK